MASKLVLILIIAVAISQTTCDKDGKEVSSTKTKITSGLDGTKDKLTSTTKTVTSKASDTAKTVTSKMSSPIGAKTLINGATKAKKVSDTVGDVKGFVTKRDVSDDLWPEGFEDESEYLPSEDYFTPQDLYNYVDERYPHVRSLIEDLLQIEPEDGEQKPKPKANNENQ